ncbi:uncharacterized protein LOC129777175 isoform X5 [Toxorhynchites rutilus septentrionalis]|uniref:uncharacterized protein LOC129777175 isoform X5 n=1 Tax=Toxorhynchites rutilus septentrionalis TaxID=329112 RepID=UPI002478B98E|nr:uncharacterized protein LOC129777175 isoform X5 [Toxorhynchites rutilus septentrionalis]
MLLSNAIPTIHHSNFPSETIACSLDVVTSEDHKNPSIELYSLQNRTNMLTQNINNLQETHDVLRQIDNTLMEKKMNAHNMLIDLNSARKRLLALNDHILQLEKENEKINERARFISDRKHHEEYKCFRSDDNTNRKLEKIRMEISLIADALGLNPENVTINNNRCQVWIDMRGKVKKTLAHNKREYRAIGGGPNTIKLSTPLQQEIDAKRKLHVALHE